MNTAVPKKRRMSYKQKTKSNMTEVKKQGPKSNTTERRLLGKRTLDSDAITPVFKKMKSCIVALNTFPGIDLSTRGNFLFFQCIYCNRFYMEACSYTTHLLTHPETEFHRHIKTITLNINSTYPTIDNDEMLLDAGKNANSDAAENVDCNVGNVTSLNPDESTSDNPTLNQTSKNGYSSGPHPSTHTETQFSRSIETTNSNTSTPTIDQESMLLDVGKDINSEASNVISVNPDQSTINNSTSNSFLQKFCCIS